MEGSAFFTKRCQSCLDGGQLRPKLFIILNLKKNEFLWSESIFDNSGYNLCETISE